MITDNMRRMVEQNTIGFVATVDAQGKPCVSPKGTFIVLDNKRIAFSDIRSPGTRRNIRANPAVEVNFIDVFRRHACRFRGEAEHIGRDDERFDELHARFSKWQSLMHRMGGIVVIEVEEAELVKSPIYDEGCDEQALVAQWLDYYQGLHTQKD